MRKIYFSPKCEVVPLQVEQLMDSMSTHETTVTGGSGGWAKDFDSDEDDESYDEGVWED